MKRLLFAFAVLGVSACGGGGSDDPVAKMKGFKDQMCACKDEACKSKVADAQDDWESAAKKGKKPSEEAFAKIMDLKAEMMACAVGGE